MVWSIHWREFCSYIIQKNARIVRSILVAFSRLDWLFNDICAFFQMISFGSGATHTSNTWGLLVRGVLAAVVSEVRSRKVTKPVEDMLDPTTTLSTAWSKQEWRQMYQLSKSIQRQTHIYSSTDAYWIFVLHNIYSPTCRFANLKPDTTKSRPKRPAIRVTILLLQVNFPGVFNFCRRRDLAFPYKVEILNTVVRIV